MILIAQIILTVVAWNKGWKWHSLAPMAIAFFTGFMVGFSGGEIGQAAFIIDLMALVALIVMSTNKPKQKNNDNKIDTRHGSL